MKKLLVLAPHTDDGELGAGGTISRLIREGWEVHYVAFSHCYKKGLKIECVNACEILRIHPENVIICNYEVRNFDKARQSILDTLIVVKEQFNPDMVFIPSLNDVHQDHNVVLIPFFLCKITYL